MTSSLTPDQSDIWPQTGNSSTQKVASIKRLGDMGDTWGVGIRETRANVLRLQVQYMEAKGDNNFV